MADPEEIIEVIVLEQRYAVSDLRPTASKARRSPVWNHFRFLPSDETMIVCIHCWPSGVAMLEEKKIITRAFSFWDRVTPKTFESKAWSRHFSQPSGKSQ
jgi:hypothetical protein